MDFVHFGPDHGFALRAWGKPAPDFADGLRKGSNLYSGSVVVLDAKTGAYKSHFKIVPRDWHDWDVSSAPAIIQTAGGKKLLSVAPKDGHLYGFDLTSNDMLYRKPVTRIENADATFSAGNAVHFCPGSTGGAEWNGPAYDPKTNLILTGEVQWCTTVTLQTDNKILSTASATPWSGEASINPFNTWGKACDWAGWVYASDADSGDWKWRVKTNYPIQSGVTPTAGGLALFGDMGGNFYAVDVSNGNKLWGEKIGGAIGGGVITYTASGAQKIAVASGLTEVLWPTEITTAGFQFWAWPLAHELELMESPQSKLSKHSLKDQYSRTALVFQGGGALGAYQAGVYEALVEAGFEPDWLSGISIGAINSAIIAGNEPEARVPKLRAFWEQMTTSFPWPAFDFGDDARRLFEQLSGFSSVLFGQAGFFTPRYPPAILQPQGAKVPPIEIGGEFYWDGGLVSNTPLMNVLDGTLKDDTLVFQVDLFDANGELPGNLLEVEQRRKHITYSSRTRLNTDSFREKHKLRHAIVELYEQLPAELRESEQMQKLRRLGDDHDVAIVHLIYRRAGYESQDSDYEFSRRSMMEHWSAGLEDGRRTLQHPRWQQESTDRTGVQVFDLSRSPL